MRAMADLVEIADPQAGLDVGQGAGEGRVGKQRLELLHPGRTKGRGAIELSNRPVQREANSPFCAEELVLPDQASCDDVANLLCVFLVRGCRLYRSGGTRQPLPSVGIGELFIELVGLEEIDICLQ
jgi:hypothetical protein